MAALGAMAVCGLGSASAQGPQPTEGAESLPKVLPAGAYQTPPAVGLPYSKLFKNTGAPYTNPIQPIVATPSVHTESIDAYGTFGLPPVIATFPLIQRGFEPQDADLKLGPVFFKLQGLSAAALWSDNINLTETDRESDVIGIVTLTGSVYAQLTEGLRLAVSGSLVWLPFENEFGVAGFGLYSPFLFGFDSQPIVRSEITWQTMIGGWNVVFADDFQIGIARFSTNVRDTAVLYSGGGFDGYDQAGRYVFRAPQNNYYDNDRDYDYDYNEDFVYYSNIISAQVDRLIVGKTRLRVQASHENLWYNQGNRGLPSLRDQVNVSLVSERENMRFRPFLIYQALKTDLQDSFQQSVRGGVDGPITNQMQFHGEVGWYFGDDEDAFLWLVSLRHQLGPYTEQSIFYGRTVNSFYDQLNEAWGYNIRQIIGPKLIADAFVLHNNVEDLLDDGFSYREWRTGVRLSIIAGPKTNFILTGTYSLVDSDEGQSHTWTGLASVSHYFTETFLGRLVYQYQQNDSDIFDDSYYENLIYVSLTKYFN
jgi:hypothetical protein